VLSAGECLRRPRAVLAVAAALPVASLSLLTACGDGSDAEILVAQIDSEGSRIILNVAACGGDLTYTVQELSDAIEVTVSEGDGTDDSCDTQFSFVPSEPLGDRELIDGTTGEAVTVEPALE